MAKIEGHVESTLTAKIEEAQVGLILMPKMKGNVESILMAKIEEA